MKSINIYIIVFFLFLTLAVNLFAALNKQNNISQVNNSQINKKNEKNSQSKNDENEIINKIAIFEKNKNYVKAEVLYKELIEKFPNKNNYLDFGHFYARQKKFDLAVPLFYKGVNNLKFDYALLEDVFYKYQLYEELLKLYLKGEKEFEDVYLKRYFAQEALSMFKLLGKFDEAIVFVNDKLIHTSDRPAFYFKILSDIAINEEKTEKVFKAYEELSKADLKPYTRFLLHRERGEILFYLAKYSESVEDYKIAIRSSYFSQYDVEYLFKKFESKNCYEETLTLVNNYIEYLEKKGVDKKLERFYYDLLQQQASLYRILDQNEKAEAIYLDLIKEVENKEKSNNYLLGELYFQLGRIYFDNGLYQKAIATFLSVDKKRVKESRIYIARCYIAQSAYEDAEKILLISGESSEARYYSSLIALFQNKIEQSMESLEILILQYADSERSIMALQKLEMLYQIQKNEEKLKVFIDFEQLWERQDLKALDDKREQFIELFSDNEDQKSYFLIYYAELFILKKKYEEAEKLLLSINEKAHHPFWKQKSSFLLGKVYIEKLNKKEEGVKILLDLLKKHPKTIFLLPAKELINENKAKVEKKSERPK